MTIQCRFVIAIFLVIEPIHAAFGAGELFVARPAPVEWWGLSGQSWSALFRSKTGFEIKDVRAKIYVDSRDHVIKLGAQNSPDPLVFIKGLDLKTGPVTPVTGLAFGTPLAMNEKTRIEFLWAQSKWILTRSTGKKTAGPSDKFLIAETHYQLRDEKGQHILNWPVIDCRLSTALNETVCGEKITPNFIGDLDRDGIPDFYIGRGETETATLWLSKTNKVAELQLPEKKVGPFRAITRPVGQDAGLDDTTPGLLIPGAEMNRGRQIYSFDSWYGVNTEKASGKATQSLTADKIWVACREGGCEDSMFVESVGALQPVFFFRGIKGAKPGSITTGNIEAAKSVADDAFDSYAIRFGAKTYSLQGGKQAFTIGVGTTSASFTFKTVDPDDKPKLIWAGDLDHNGQLDLLFRVPTDERDSWRLVMNGESGAGVNVTF